MPHTKPVAVKDLALDLQNFRTVRQTSELAAVDAMISTSPDRFWALTESLLKDGYLPTESIIVLQPASGSKRLTVREGNRRIAALKLLHGLLPMDELSVPSDVAAQMKSVSSSWRTANKEVPCTVYEATEAATVDRIVTLAHGKGEKARVGRKPRRGVPPNERGDKAHRCRITAVTVCPEVLTFSPSIY